MSRDSSGNYTLPSTYNPVVSGTTILTAWGNTTLNDIGSELTSSLDRSGRGSMLAQFKAVDGSVGAPGISFGNETTMGWYRSGAGAMSAAVGGAIRATITSAGLAVVGALTAASMAMSAAAPLAFTVTDSADSTASYLGADATGGYVGTSTNHPFRIRSNAVDRISLANTGSVSIVVPTSGTNATLSLAGSSTNAGLQITGTGANMIVDGDNATLDNRFAFKTVTTNATTSVEAVPNGTATAAQFTAWNAASRANASYGGFGVSNTSVAVISGKGGAGTFLPMTFSVSGGNRLQILATTTLHPVQIADAAGTFFNAGFLESPINAQNGNYTFTISDSGKTIRHTSGTPHTYTIPDSAGAAPMPYPSGTMISIVNQNGSGNLTIAVSGSDVLRWAGTTSTGSRTLAANGMCTLEQVTGGTPATWYITGVGIS